MAATIAKDDKLSLKLMVHKEGKRVIYAEANYNFVDALFSFMTLPMATIVRLLGKFPDEKFKPLGSLTSLYQSLNDLPASYLSSEESKFVMLNVKTSSHAYCRKLKLNLDDAQPTKYFRCNSGCRYFSTCNFAICGSCKKLMETEFEYGGSTVADVDGGLFVSDVATFIITDGLRVMPTTLCSIAQLLLCDLGITEASQLAEMTFDVGHQQILMLLRLALLFKNPLSELVFSSMHHIRYSVNFKKETPVKHLFSEEVVENGKRMTLKVILQKSTSKFLFAEADEVFVEFVFGFLEIPLGTLIGKLMNGSSSLDSLDNLFASISNVRMKIFIKSQNQEMLLTPQLVEKHISRNQIFPLNFSKSSLDAYQLNTYAKFYLNDPRITESFMKAAAKFMMTDDVEEHELSIGIEEGLRILKASLISSSTFSDALLNKNSSCQDK